MTDIAERLMVQILVRRVDDAIVERLRARARRDGHSLEEECRLALLASAQREGLLAAVAAWRASWPEDVSEDALENAFEDVRQLGPGRPVELE